MGEFTFNRNECIKALSKLGFYLANKRSGKHDKFKSPIPNCNPPFIMIPRHNDLHCQKEIIAELQKMGGNELIEKFRSLL